MTDRQTGVWAWSDQERDLGTSGIEVSHMTYAALQFDPPELWTRRLLDVEDAIAAAVWRTTEYAIREAAPDGPPAPAAYPPDVDALYRLRAAQDDVEQQTLDAV